MKKVIAFIMTIILAFAMISCTCSSNSTPALGDSEVAVVDSMFVEHTIAMDRQAMYNKVGGDYRWYETCIKLNNWLDEDNDGSIEMMVNVFQVVESRETGSFDTYVYKFQHFANGESAEDSVHGFWVEDWPLEEEEIKVTFAQAFDLVMRTNYPKPHTHNVVLRKEVGPKACNPQWIFGNLKEQLYVDAVTGEVRPTSPAFNSMNLGTPLGEWP